MTRKIYLTKRQKEVLSLCAYANAEIAQRLGLSLGTVKNYFLNIGAVLGTSGRADSLVTALKLGLIAVDELASDAAE